MWQYHSDSDKLSLISEDFTPLVNLCRFFEQKEIKKYFFLKYFSFLSFWEIKRNFRKYFFISEKERNIWISNLNISQRKKEIEIFFSRPRKKEIFRNPKRKFLAKPWFGTYTLRRLIGRCWWGHVWWCLASLIARGHAIDEWVAPVVSIATCASLIVAVI